MPNKLVISKEETRFIDESNRIIQAKPALVKTVKANSKLQAVITEVIRQTGEIDDFTEQDFEDLIKANPDLREAAKSSKVKEDIFALLTEVAKDKIIKIPLRPERVIDPSDKTDEAAVSIEDTSESENFLEYLRDIPIARRGDIITSFHHNSLRNALYALAGGLGDTTDLQILTFAPDFLPTSFTNNREEKTGNWKVIFNRAVVPSVNEQGGAGGTVTGAFAVRLPENFFIKSMIVRGRRSDEEADDPKKFDVSLLRYELGKAKPAPAVLLNVDLKDKTGFFQEEDVTTALKSQVDNNKFQYFVSAYWQDADDSSGFEIHSIQIICEP